MRAVPERATIAPVRRVPSDSPLPRAAGRDRGCVRAPACAARASNPRALPRHDPSWRHAANSTPTRSHRSPRIHCARSPRPASRARFPRNAVLINEGELGDSLFIVLSGRRQSLREQRGRQGDRHRFPRSRRIRRRDVARRLAAVGVGDDDRADDLRHRQPRAASASSSRASGLRAAPDRQADPARAAGDRQREEPRAVRRLRALGAAAQQARRREVDGKLVVPRNSPSRTSPSASARRAT